jgi:CDP-2,3-bis-(O-geranylgeranyl)-sn-glycerol synthase
MYLNIPELVAFLAPVYLSNAMPVLFGGGLPLDFNKKFLDGEPILGPHKTFRGILGGIGFGLCASILLAFVLGREWLLFGFLASIGSLIGDLIGAFIKRRIKLKAGAPAPFLDQLDFIICALALVHLVRNLHMTTILISLLLTPILHLLTNVFAYKLRLKEVPW